MKLCKDCAHFRRSWVMDARGYSRCLGKPGAEEVEPVMGRERGDRRGYCDINRKYDWLCGPDAKWFAPRRTFWMRVWS